MESRVERGAGGELLGAGSRPGSPRARTGRRRAAPRAPRRRPARTRTTRRSGRAASPRRSRSCRRGGSRRGRPPPRRTPRARSRRSPRGVGSRAGRSRPRRLDYGLSAPVAQGIERAPPERKAEGSNPSRRILSRLKAPLSGAVGSFDHWAGVWPPAGRSPAPALGGVSLYGARSPLACARGACAGRSGQGAVLRGRALRDGRDARLRRCDLARPRGRGAFGGRGAGRRRSQGAAGARCARLRVQLLHASSRRHRARARPRRAGPGGGLLRRQRIRPDAGRRGRRRAPAGVFVRVDGETTRVPIAGDEGLEFVTFGRPVTGDYEPPAWG